MSPLPVISGVARIAALAELGYTVLDRGTLRSIIRTAEISVEEFNKLVG